VPHRPGLSVFDLEALDAPGLHFADGPAAVKARDVIQLESLVDVATFQGFPQLHGVLSVVDMNVCVTGKLQGVIASLRPLRVRFPDQVAVMPFKAGSLFLCKPLGGNVAVGGENVGVKVSLVVFLTGLVDGVLSHHPLGDQVVLDEAAHQVLGLLPVQLLGDGKHPFAAGDGVGLMAGVLGIVPQAFCDRPVQLLVAGIHAFEVFGCILWGKDALGDDVLFAPVGELVVVRLEESVRFLVQIHAVHVGRSPHGAHGLETSSNQTGALDCSYAGMKALCQRGFLFVFIASGSRAEEASVSQKRHGVLGGQWPPNAIEVRQDFC